MDLGGLLSKEPDSGPAGGKLRELIDSTDQALELVRNLSSRLRPPILDVMGLGPALKWQVQEMCGRAGLFFQVDVPPGGVPLSGPVAVTVFRIAQEALTNILRHAEAHRVTVSLRRDKGWGVLEIMDDGRGIREEEIRSSVSLGLLGMQERALGLGGALSLEPFSPRGTRLQLRFPLDSPVSQGKSS